MFLWGTTVSARINRNLVALGSDASQNISNLHKKHPLDRIKEDTMTKAIRIHEYGGADNMTWEDVDVGAPGRVRFASNTLPLV